MGAGTGQGQGQGKTTAALLKHLQDRGKSEQDLLKSANTPRLCCSAMRTSGMLCCLKACMKTA